MKLDFWPKNTHVFLVGAGGASMSSLAFLLRAGGYAVSGSDSRASERTAKLEEAGVRVHIGHAAENIEGADAVAASSAVPQDAPELLAAKERGIPVYSRAELLSLVAGCFRHTVAFAGCHGKTTATAMCAHVFAACGADPSAHIGGEDLDYGNFRVGGNGWFLTEACEYRANFLQLRPETAVILNTDADHLECYAGPAALAEAYERFARGAKQCILCGDDPAAARIPAALTFGLSERCAVSAANLRRNGGRYSFTLRLRGQPCGRVRLRAFGRHNVYNALAAASAAFLCGFPAELVVRGLQEFRGVRRRFEPLGRFCGADCIADYAHHPREIEAAMEAVRVRKGGRLIVVFQPHTYSRTRLLFEDFVRVLSRAEHLVVYKTFPAREYFDAAGSALTLSQSLPRSLYIETPRELEIYLRCSLRPGDAVLFLGAGDIYTAARRLLGAKL